MIQIPPGAKSGQTIQAKTPDGKTVQTVVPPGMKPGQQLKLQIAESNTSHRPTTPITSANSSRTMLAQIPAGAKGGDKMQVKAPDGKMLQVLIPPGMKAGQNIQCAY